jgi:molybdopterin biosynthesis enzyme
MTLDVIGEIKAASASKIFRNTLQVEQAASIMTGAPVPSGADAVVMVEYAQQGARVQITRSVAPGENIVPTAQKHSRAACWWNEARA